MFRTAMFRPAMLRAVMPERLRWRGLPRPASVLLITLCWLLAAQFAWALWRTDTTGITAPGTRLWMDGHAYWMAWHHLGLYSAAPRSLDAFNYSPAFAQLIWPGSLLTFAVFAAVWWTLIGAAFLWLLSPLPWYWRVPALVFTGVEIQVGNIDAFLAVMVVLGLRRPGFWSLALLTKLTPVVGLLWFATRREWRQLGAAVAASAAIITVSVAMGPHRWVEWLAFLHRASRGPAAFGMLNAGSLPVRIALAAALIVWGARSGRTWVLAVAVPLTVPLIGWSTLTILAALPRLAGREPHRTPDSSRGRAGSPALSPTGRSRENSVKQVYGMR